MKKDVKPLQVRLPADVYEALQYEASAKGSTLNAVVIDCLRTNLPHSSWVDSVLYRGPGISQDTVGNCTTNALDALTRYEEQVLTEMSILNELAQLRCAQVASATRIAKSLRNNWEVSVLDEEDLHSTNGKLNPGFLTSADTRAHKKCDDKAREGLKHVARARAEAHMAWTLFNEYLAKLNQLKSE